MNHGLLHDALIYLAAAIVFVPLAKKLGMGSVLGYLLGGIIIGPFVLGFVGEEGKDIMHFAEFGVVMMLFLIGLELEPASFWRMRKLIIGTGVLQLCGTAILDNDSDRVDLLRKMGFKVFYGDATRIDILKSAGADHAKVLIAAIDSPEINMDLVRKTIEQFPHLELMVRARNRLDAYELFDVGVHNIYRESLETSVRIGVDVLVKLGFRKYSATRAGQNFIKYDESALPTLAAHRHDKEAYIFNVRQQISIEEELLTNDRKVNPTLNDHAWDRSTDGTR